MFCFSLVHVQNMNRDITCLFHRTISKSDPDRTQNEMEAQHLLDNDPED